MTSSVLTRHLAVVAADPARDGCPGRRHGNASAVDNYGCICEDAVADSRLQRKLRRIGQSNRRVPALGYRRRVRALFRVGDSAETIAALCPGMTVAIVMHISRRPKYLPPEKAAAIAAAYEALKDVKGTSSRAAGTAAKFGHPPPEAWLGDIDDPDVQPWKMPPPPPAIDTPELEVDEVFVEQVLRGERDAKTLTRQGLERVTYAVTYLMRPGNTTSSLMRELDCSGTAANEYGAWTEAVRPALAAKGITRGWWWEVPEIATVVASERDRLRWQRARFAAATALSAVDGMHGLVLTAAIKACGKWRAWPYRVTAASLSDAA